MNPESISIIYHIYGSHDTCQSIDKVKFFFKKGMLKQAKIKRLAKYHTIVVWEMIIEVKDSSIDSKGLMKFIGEDNFIEIESTKKFS